ncbi:MAG: threonine synthase, partial [Lachnospiraceae bacterium]|nr:threonine synthase [Lachnospiraceae bacterium]
LVPQVVYYVYAYTRLLAQGVLKNGEPMNVVVPTGNFGNILAAFYAKQMGIPIAKLICASNENKVLFDFFSTGTYDRNRKFILTSSPSMDILISSNLERLIYQIAGNDPDICAALMQALSESGKYSITPAMKVKLDSFYGNYATEAETAQRIAEVYREEGYVMDTHTAVASAVYEKYRKETNDETVTVVASTASPYKFLTSVLEAVGALTPDIADDEFAKVDRLYEVSGVAIPPAVEELRHAEILHKRECDPEDMKKTVLEILGLK